MADHTQEDVDDMQAALLAGEKVFKPAVHRIATSVEESDKVSPEMKKALHDCGRALRAQIRAFHSIATACGASAGFATNTVDPDKD